jgi:DNA-damage-inducible protein D
MNTPDTLIVFESTSIRRIHHNGEWWFSVVDVIAGLTESQNPSTYWRVLKKRLLDEGGHEAVTNCNGLKLSAPDGKMRVTDCANTETLFRLIQSIPSPRAEPFKRWLAQVGYERVQEIEDPERATARARALYRAKGYDEAWIEKRMRGIAIREELTGGMATAQRWPQQGICDFNR